MLGVHSFDEISAVELGFQNFIARQDVLFFDFSFHLRLFDGIRFYYSQVFVIFLFSERSDLVKDW